jgi:hypothetical protein
MEMTTTVSGHDIDSPQGVYLRLLEAFPAYVADFNARWERWQQEISTRPM